MARREQYEYRNDTVNSTKSGEAVERNFNQQVGWENLKTDPEAYYPIPKCNQSLFHFNNKVMGINDRAVLSIFYLIQI